jgi:hypothetical protein
VKNVQLKNPVSFTHFASKSRRKHISPTGDPPPPTFLENKYSRKSVHGKRRDHMGINEESGLIKH